MPGEKAVAKQPLHGAAADGQQWDTRHRAIRRRLDPHPVQPVDVRRDGVGAVGAHVHDGGADEAVLAAVGGPDLQPHDGLWTHTTRRSY